MRSIIVGPFCLISLFTFAQSHQLGQKKVTLVPESYLRGYDPITLFFPDDEGPVDYGPLDNPDGVVNLNPSHPGDWGWVDRRTLQFNPTTAWPALEKYRLTIGKKTFDLVTFMSAPVVMNPRAGATNLDPIRDFSFEFAYAIQPQRLAEMLSFRVQELPGLSSESTRILTHKNFVVKKLERASLQDRSAYVVHLNEEISFGQAIEIRLKLSLNEKDQRSLASFRVQTRPRFRLIAAGTHSIRYPIAVNGSMYSAQQVIHAGTGSSPLFLEFSAAPEKFDLADVKRMVRFEPQVRNLSADLSGNRILLHFECDRERLYRIDIAHTPIRDQSDRSLDEFGPSSLFFAYQSQTPYLRWRQEQGILETYGPQQIPLEGRGYDAIDLRIFKIGALDRNFWPFPRRGVSVNEDQRPPGPGEEPDYATDMSNQIQLLGSPLISRVVATPLRPTMGSHVFGVNITEMLTEISGKEKPGTYLVGYRLLGSENQRRYARIQVTDLNVTSIEEEGAVVFFVTSLKSADPVAGAEVVIEGNDDADGTRHIILRGKTDASGKIRFVHDKSQEIYVSRVSVRNGQDTLVIDPELPPPSFDDNHWYGSGARYLSWLNRSPQTSKDKAEIRAFIAPERPMYRPEEVVHIKGYLRRLIKDRIETVTDGKWQLVVRGPGAQQWTFPLELTVYGSFYHAFELEDAPTGNYEVQLHDLTDDRWVGWASFAKEAYRIPRFEVLLDGPDETPLDRSFDVNLTAEFYAGGRVVDHQVSWQITPFPYRFQPKSFPGFLFSSDERFRGNMPPISRETQQFFDRTDDNGGSTVKIDPTQELSGEPRRYVIEATVEGADEQTVTATKRVLVLPPFALGLKLDRVIKGHKLIKPQSIVLGFDGKPIAGHEVRTRVYRREWHANLVESDFTTGPAKYQTDVVDTLVKETLATSTESALTHEFDMQESGVYVIEITARDQLGRLQTVRGDVLILGESPVTWDKKKELLFDVVWDKSKYDPGEQAQLVLKPPFQRGRALVVVEDKAETTYHWVHIKNGQGVFTIRVNGDMAPRIPVYVLAMRGRLDRNNSTVPDAFFKPKTVGSSSWLNVKPKSLQMKLALNHAVKNLPGSKMKMQIELTDPDGEPLDGEVTLWLVDRAVLALAKEMDLNPVDTFLRDGYRWIRLRDGRNEVIGELPLEELPGGDGAAKSEESLFERVTVRKNFKTVPYYNPHIDVKGGQAELEIELPDNLTEFAVRAIATDGNRRFALAKSRLAIRLPVIVQAALPRFVRHGDEFVAGGIGRVVEGEGGKGRVELQIEGLETASGTSWDVDWQPNTAQQLYLPMKVVADAAAPGQDANTITFQMAVERSSDGSRDAFKVNLPVLADRAWINEESFGEATLGVVTPLLNPQENVLPGSMKRSLLVAADPALVRMIMGLEYLRRYPYGCAEQRVSRLYPEVALKQVLAAVGVNDRAPEMQRWMDDTLLFLKEAQSESGLFGYWPGSTGYVGLTAYVCEFLLEAEKAGYLVDAGLLDRGLRALAEALRSDSRFLIKAHAYSERTFALATLAKAGRLDRSYAFELASRGQNLTLESEAKVLYVLATHNLRTDANKSLIEDLERSLIFTLKDNQRVFTGLQYRSTSWGGRIHSSEVRTVAEVMRALYAVDKNHSSVPILKQALLDGAGNNGWGSTNANAAAILALRDLPEGSGLGGGSLDLRHPSKPVRSFELRESMFTQIDIAADEVGQLVLQGVDKPALLWQRLDYLPAGPGSLTQATASGFAVDRTWLVFKDLDAPAIRTQVTAGSALEVQVGDVVEEYTRVVNAEDRVYVAISIPFAAGFDPLNANLATAPPEATPQGQLSKEPTYIRFSDDQIVYFYNELPAGSYDFFVRLKASFEGTYTQPPAFAEMMYQQAVMGRSPGSSVVISAKQKD